MSKRKFPSYTLTELKQMLIADLRPFDALTDEQRVAIEGEIAAREAGVSKVTVTPQVSWGGKAKVFPGR